MRERTGLVLAIMALTAASGCETPATASYSIERACEDAGYVRGSATFNTCVSERQSARLRNIYDTMIRTSTGFPGN